MRQRKPLFPESYDHCGSLKHVNRHEWVESAFTSSQNARAEVLGTSIPEKRTRVLSLIIISVISIFFFRTAYLQLFEGRWFSLLAERNKVKTIILPAKRGVILDRHGVILARNVPTFQVHIRPADIPSGWEERKIFIARLSNFLHLPESEIYRVISDTPLSQSGILMEHIDYHDALKFEIAFTEFNGVELVISERREYATKGMESLSHILGYTGRLNKQEYGEKKGLYSLNDSIGKDGLEFFYESILRGIFGKREIEVDALGIEKSILAEQQPTDGKNLILSIDASLQERVEFIAGEMLKKIGKKRAIVIVSRPHTGEIVAIVAMPSFDNNVFAKGISPSKYDAFLDDANKPLFNRGIRGEYPSGSTIKPIVAAAALHEGVVNEKSRILSSGGIYIGEWFFPDWKKGGHGATTVQKALAESVNTFFYYIGGGYRDFPGLGVNRLTSYFRKFGIGEVTGIDIPGEKDGFLPTPAWKKEKKGEIWYIGDTYHIAIGQGDILVTPLQVNTFTNYFANGGFNYRPHFVTGIQKDDYKTQPQYEKYKEGIVDKHVVTIVRDGLREAVRSGSSRRLFLLPVSSAGKTGTAQGPKGKAPHAWFTGWAPYEKPEISITVLIEEGEEGSRTAVPVAYEILKWYFAQKRN